MAELYQGKFSGEEIDSAIGDIKGLFTSGTTGQVVTKTDDGAEWADAPSGLPAGGTTGQMLAKSSDADYALEWVDPTVGPSGPGWEKVFGNNYVDVYSSGNFNFFVINQRIRDKISEWSTVKTIANTTIYYKKYNFDTPIPSNLFSSGVISVSKNYNYTLLNVGGTLTQDGTISISVFENAMYITYEHIYGSIPSSSIGLYKGTVVGALDIS